MIGLGRPHERGRGRARRADPAARRTSESSPGCASTTGSRSARATGTRSAPASAATPGSSRSSRCSGGARWRSRASRRSRRCANGRVRYHPESQHQFAIRSLEEIPDWNISRQLWWGHQLPIWYCPDGHETCAWPPPDACATCGSTELTRDPDVLDTWFSSALWPYATLGWPERTPELRALLPGRRERDRAGHHPALGEPDDLDRAGADGRAAVQRRDHHLDDPRARRAADVEEPRHRDRPARLGRAARRRRDPLRAAEDELDPGRPLRRGDDRGGAEAREQALERGAADPPARRRRDPRRAAARRSRSAGSSPGSTTRAEGSRSRLPRSTSPTPSIALYHVTFDDFCDWYAEAVKPRLYDGDEDARATALHALELAARAPPPGDAARDRGDLVAVPRRAG